MKATEIRNVTGIYDDDMLNAACECERKEELAENIAHAIVVAHGYDRGLYNGHVFDFAKVSAVLNGYGLKYAGADDDEECHYFKSKNGDEVCIYPQTYYPHLGKFKFYNFHLF